MGTQEIIRHSCNTLGLKGFLAGRRHARLLALFAFFSFLFSATSCYQHSERVKTPFEFTERQLDSLAFFSSHHYTNNFNFVVSADSLVLHKASPSEIMSGLDADSFAVYRGAHLVVAEILILNPDATPPMALPNANIGTSTYTDTKEDKSSDKQPFSNNTITDSVWVQLANDTSAFGWVHEPVLLKKAEPDDPISSFINTFSNNHLIIFLGMIAFFSAIYLLRSLTRRKAHMVHLNDVASFYPTLLCLLVAFSASLYAGIQTFVPQMWQHFYFHPTLNPFSVPMPLNIFLCSVWSLFIVAIAAADDVRHLLPPTEALLYLGGLAAMCAINYIVFSITSLYFVGYVLFVAYAYYALRRYHNHTRARYRCGRCGAILQRKGVCPHCGANNK